MPRITYSWEKIKFLYNDSVRVGFVERLSDNYLTIKHRIPSRHGGKVYSSYRFDSLQSGIRIVEPQS
jgi:hypothetical protein